MCQHSSLKLGIQLASQLLFLGQLALLGGCCLLLLSQLVAPPLCNCLLCHGCGEQ
jgi:hypothetical protein